MTKTCLKNVYIIIVYGFEIIYNKISILEFTFTFCFFASLFGAYNESNFKFFRNYSKRTDLLKVLFLERLLFFMFS